MKDIPGFEGLYAVTKDGQVWSYYKKRFLKPGLTNGGYFKVVLVKDRIHYNKLIHRLVAETYIDNPNNFPVVNHKDENKTNNNVDNLEWCTHEYNANYGTQPQRLSEHMKNFLKEHPNFRRGKNNGMAIPIRCIETGEEFETFTAAAKWCGLKDTSCFTDYFKGRQKSAGRHPVTNVKLHWEKIEKEDKNE